MQQIWQRWGLVDQNLSPSLAYFLGSTNFRQWISHTLFVGEQRNLATLGVWPIETYSPNFRNFGWGPVIPLSDMYQSFTDALVKWFFDNFPMFVDSFSVLSIHCVVSDIAVFVLKRDVKLQL